MMKNRYRYRLQTGSRKYRCPQCGHKTFVPFVYNDGGNDRLVDVERFGRCDRQQKCGYYLYPHDITPVYQYTPQMPKEAVPDFVPPEYVKDTLRLFDRQTLFEWCLASFSREELTAAWLRYRCGTARNGATIWWQVDAAGNVRTGKIMQYLSNGHRNKADFGTWVHKRIKKDFVLKQCLFGEHLVTEGARVAVCESEKTAVLMSMLRPGYLWMATGGLQNIQAYKFAPLFERACRVVLFPDKGCLNIWKNRLGTANFSYDDEIEESGLPSGSDILDLYFV